VNHLSFRQDLDNTLVNFDLLTCFPTLFEFDALEEEDLQKTLETIELDILALPRHLICGKEGYLKFWQIAPKRGWVF
jgi:hypothetical protein